MNVEEAGPLTDITRWARIMLSRWAALNEGGAMRNPGAAEFSRWLRGEGPPAERLARARAVEAELASVRGRAADWPAERPADLRWHEFIQLGRSELERDLLALLVAFDTHPRVAAFVRAASGWTDACGIERTFAQSLLDPFETQRAAVAEMLRAGHPLMHRGILKGLGESDSGRPRFVELSPALLTWLLEGPETAASRLGRLRWESSQSTGPRHSARSARGPTAGYDVQMLQPIAERLAREGRVRLTASAAEDVMAAARVLAESNQEPLAILDLGLENAQGDPPNHTAELVAQAALLAELSTAALVITGVEGGGRREQDEVGPAKQRTSSAALARALAASRARVIIADTASAESPTEGEAQHLSAPAELARRLGCSSMALPFPDEARRVELWQRMLGPRAAVNLAERLARFPLSPAQMAKIATSLWHEQAPVETWVEHCREAVGHRVGELAQRVRASATWNEVILPEPVMEVVNEVLLYAREGRRVLGEWGLGARHSYGLGLSALFSGPPGTGKTLLAGLIARELGLDLFRIDLSRIVSKYIGETEQRLARLFDEARRGGVALLFDEADSLFATRTEVKSSVDRYANLEVNFLLQKMEHYDGLVMLTTNLADSLDEAFRRRIRFHARFPLPNATERARLWRSMIPRTAPQAPDIDWDRLAQVYEFSGGEIKNAALRAAFYAADSGRPLDLGHLDRASQAEYRERGRLVLRTATTTSRPY